MVGQTREISVSILGIAPCCCILPNNKAGNAMIVFVQIVSISYFLLIIYLSLLKY